jgi:glucokinase
MILAGDIGGTKTNLALYDWKAERVEPTCEQTFASADYKSLEDILEEFLNSPPEPSDEKNNESREAPVEEAPRTLDAACFGIAGPVIENTSKTTNLPWVVDGAALSKRFKIPGVKRGRSGHLERRHATQDQGRDGADRRRHRLG